MEAEQRLFTTLITNSGLVNVILQCDDCIDDWDKVPTKIKRMLTFLNQELREQVAV